MKIKKLLCVLPFLFFTETHADYGMIQDPDGYVNVRDQASLKAKVIAKLNNGTVVYCHPSTVKETFCHASSAELSERKGKIHNSRINYFKNYQKWRLTSQSEYMATYTYNQNKITIQVMDAKFNVADFKKEYFKKYNQYFYTKYKNKPFLGTDGGLPSEDGIYQLREIKITYNGKTTIIPQQNLEQYFFPNTPLKQGGMQDYEMAEIYSKDDDLYILNALNIGGAARYNLMLHIRDGKLIKQSAW